VALQSHGLFKQRQVRQVLWAAHKPNQISVSSVVAGTPCRMAPLMPTI
jgi:hypothetical protein